MSENESFRLTALIEELAYHDHVHETDVVNEVLNLVFQIRSEEISRPVAVELLNERLELLKQNSVLDDPEHIRVAEQVFLRLPNLLFI